MRKWNRALGVLFLVVLAVYFGHVVPAVLAEPVNNPDSSAPATQPAADPFASTTQPVSPKLPAAAVPKITTNDTGTFSIQINNDVPLVEVLRMIGSQAQVSIIPSREVRGTVPAMDLYNVTVNEALDALLESNGFGYEQKGNIIYVYSDKELADRQKKNLDTTVYRLYYIAAADAMSMIKPHLSAEGVITVTPAAASDISGSGSSGSGGSGGSATSGGGGSSSGGGASSGGGSSGDGNSYANVDMLVITDHPAVQEKIARIVKEIDRRPKQVLVEATILEAEITENNALGMNLTALGSINFADLGVLPGTGAGNVLTSGGTKGGNLGNTVSSVPTNISPTSAKAGFNSVQTGQGGLAVGIVQDNIAVFLQALESVTNVTILSNPKVLTLDKTEGKVHIGETIYYQGTNTATATTNTVTVSSLDTGITLDFRPYIGDDGYIRLEIDPSDSLPEGVGANGLPPNINANEVTSNIMVKDGHTVVIGGMFQDNSNVSKAQVPFFGNLPLAGPLFGQQTDTTDRREIIFLLTPHIVKDDEAFSQMSEQEMRDAEKLRVGVREGMMPWGRERLADSCYECALTELHKPHPDMNMVRWHLDCATNLNPQFLEAINLKEQITGQVVTTADNSSIRSFVRRQMELDRLHGVSLEAAPARAVKISATVPPTTPVLTTQPTAQADPAPTAQPVVEQAPQTPATAPSVALAPTTGPSQRASANNEADVSKEEQE